MGSMFIIPNHSGHRPNICHKAQPKVSHIDTIVTTLSLSLIAHRRFLDGYLRLYANILIYIVI